MASISPLVLSPTTILALLGKIRGEDPTRPTSGFQWREAVVDVIVPAKNEEELIALCLASILDQDFPVRRIVVIDDASTDRTAEVVRRFQELSQVPIELRVREVSIGKTPSIREFCHTTDADAIVVVDGDTILSNRNYISHVLQELFRNPGVASSCGEIMPLGHRRRRAITRQDERVRRISREFGLGLTKRKPMRALLEGLTYIYRSALYVFLHRFLYDGHLKLFGSRLNPIGCAVAYRTARLRECFDWASPRMGDNLSTSEDIFIGHFFAWKGWRNVQALGSFCESDEPPVTRLPYQLYLWSSSFLQTQYYFKELPLSMFKQLKRLLRFRRWPRKKDRRRIREQYRAPWGEDYTYEYGRPLGIVTFWSMVEKVSYPLFLFYFSVFDPETLFFTLALEAGLSAASVFLVAGENRRLRSAAMMVAATPIRVLSLAVDLVSVAKYVADLITGNRDWRK